MSGLRRSHGVAKCSSFDRAYDQRVRTAIINSAGIDLENPLTGVAFAQPRDAA